MLLELKPVFDSAKSYYGKAQVEVNDGEYILYSYGLKIAVCKECAVIVCPVDKISTTTLRHLKEFLKQNQWLAENKSQIIKDYL